MARSRKSSRSRKSRKPPKSRVREILEGAWLEQINLNAAGIDVGAESHWVAVPPDRDDVPVQEFDAFTCDLYRLSDWLEQCQVDTVVLESTGVYWIPLFEVLEERGFDVQLVDARRLKNVPGRKTDVEDSQWAQTLHTFGLLSAAFRPTEQISVLRSYVRQRAMLVESASRHIQHMQKALTQMNVKLQHVVSDVTGKTGLAIIRAILAGERDAQVLAKLRDPRCRKSEGTIAKALQGHWREDHLFELAQAVALYDQHRKMLLECDERIESHLDTFEDRVDPDAIEPRPYRRGPNGVSFDLHQHMVRITGVDLTTIDGINPDTALKIVSEIGLDMTRWESSKHFASWLALCPGMHRTGNKSYRCRTRPSANRAAAALRVAALCLNRSQSALGSYFRRTRARLGPPKAITATAHKLARIIYSMLRNGTSYTDPGPEAYEAQQQARALATLKRKAKRLGYSLVENATSKNEPAPTPVEQVT